MAKSATKQMWKRMLVVMGVLIIGGFFLLTIRLFKLQIIDNEFYQDKALDQQLRELTIAPKRGTIYDRNMTVIAQNTTVWTISVSPSSIKDEHKELVAKTLSSILELKQEDVMKKLNKKTSYETIARRVDAEKTNQIREFMAKNTKISGIQIDEDSKRVYPNGSFASTVIGFTGTDNQGLSGLEAYYDKDLKGVSGKVVAAKNAWGDDMPVKYQKMIDAQNGNNLVLTIDSKIQEFLQKHLLQAVSDNKLTNKAAGIVMDAKTGEILAMATEPGFDMNEPFEISDETVKAEIKKLTGDERKKQISLAQSAQWRNKAVSDTYEPGSVFKIITSAAGLEDKVVKPTDTFYCSGSIRVMTENMHCWKTAGHGAEDFVAGVLNSCNPVFITIGQRLGANRFFNYFNAFGLTQKTGIDLPGEADSIYHSEKNLTTVSLSSSSFGQTFKVTPIQMITAVTAVANGGNLLQPHVVKQVLDADGNIVSNTQTVVKRQVISEETCETLNEILRQNGVSGTAKNAYVRGYRVAGKTGTSEKLDKKDEAGNANERIASFCGFAPADDPEIVVLVMLDEPHGWSKMGGAIAAPVVGRIMADVLPYLGVEPKYTEEELATMDISVPPVAGSSVASAKSKLTSAGLQARVIGTGDKVVRQIPAAGQTIPKDGRVVLYTQDEKPKKVKVPDLTGLSVSQVNQRAVDAGINVRMTGSVLESGGAISNSQSIGKDTEVEVGTVITVGFVHQDGVE